MDRSDSGKVPDTDPLGDGPRVPPDSSTQLDLEGPSDEELARWESFGELLGQALRMPTRSPTLISDGSIGQFTILRPLGVGGCGMVYLAQDPVLRREVAIKVPHGALLQQKDRHDRFVQEARIVARLQHTHIVEIFQVGCDTDIQFLVFEYCGGGSLAEWMVKRATPPAVELCVRIIIALARAVDYAHQQGVVHRDINPRNILLVPLADRARSEANVDFPYIPKLSDFGLGTWLEQRSTAVQTQAGAVMGTLPYMAPEQTRSGDISLPATIDIYALGAMLYELLAGQRPFVGKNQVDTLRLIQEAEPVAPSQLRSGIPRDVDTICLKCLEKAPTRRFATAGELADELERFLAGHPIQTRRVSLIEKALRWAVKRRQQLMTVSVVVLLLLIIGAGGSWYAEKLRAARQNEEQLKQKSAEQDQKLIQAKVNDLRLQQEIRERTRRANYDDQIEAISGLAAGRSFEVIQRLREWIPRAGESDLRGFEWYYLMHLAGGDAVAFATFDSSAEHLEALHVSDVGDAIYTAQGNRITEWDSRTGRSIRTIHETSGTIRDFAISHHSGRLIVSTYNSTDTHLVDLTSKTSKTLHHNRNPALNWCNQLMFNPSGTSFYGLYAKDQYFRNPETVEEYSLGTPDVSRTFRLPEFRITQIAFDPSTEQIVSTASDGVFVCSKGEHAGQHLQISSDGTCCTALAISPDSQKLAVSTELRDILFCQRSDTGRWREVGKLPVKLRGRAQSHPHQYMHHRCRLQFGHTANRLFSNAEFEITLWDLATRRSLSFIHHPPGESLRGLEVLPDRRTAVWTTDGALGLWRPSEDIPGIAGHQKETWTVAFSPDGKWLATGSDDETIGVWDMQTGRKLFELTGHRATVSKVAFAPLGDLLASASLDGTIRIWDLKSRQLLRELKGHIGSVRGLQWFADGVRLAAGDSTDSHGTPRVVVWNASTGHLWKTFEGIGDHIHSVLATQDQQSLVAVSNDRIVWVWNPDSGELVHKWMEESSLRSALLLNQDQWLATGNNSGVIHVREMTTGKVLQELLGHTDPVLALAISPDGRVLASGGEDKTVRLWDMATGRALLVLKDQGVQINSVEFSPNGEILAAGGHDGSVKLYYGPRFTPLPGPQSTPVAARP